MIHSIWTSFVFCVKQVQIIDWTEQTCINSFIMLKLQTVREKTESAKRPADVSEIVSK